MKIWLQLLEIKLHVLETVSYKVIALRNNIAIMRKIRLQTVVRNKGALMRYKVKIKLL